MDTELKYSNIFNIEDEEEANDDEVEEEDGDNYSDDEDTDSYESFDN